MTVNVINIVRQGEEDPIESILKELAAQNAQVTCFPGAYDRECQRKGETEQDMAGVWIHRFQLRVPNPQQNQMRTLGLLMQMQLHFAEEALALSNRLVAIVAVNKFDV